MKRVNLYRVVASFVLLLSLGLSASASLFAQIPMNAQDILRSQQSRNNPNDPFADPYADPNANPEEMDQQNPQDTTQKEKKPRMPLESYFFSDSIRSLNYFTWNISREYNKVDIEPLDSMLSVFRIDHPYQSEGVGDITLGGLGQPTQAIDYFDRSVDPNFKFTQTYNSYLYDMENVTFYNVKKAYTQLDYIESGQKSKREINFGITHAQNITPSTGFVVDYKSRGTRGLFNRQDADTKNLALLASHNGKRYTVHGGFIYNHLEQEENGGVVAPWAVRDTTFELQVGIPMKLADAEAVTKMNNIAVFVEQSYGIPFVDIDARDFSIAHKPAIYFGHSIEYSRWSKSYKDIRSTYIDERFDRDENGGFVQAEKEYYDNWYINPEASRDTLRESLLSNRLFVQAQPWDRDGAVGTLNGGVGLDYHTFSQFMLDDYISGKLTTDKKMSYYGYGSIEGKIKKYIDWGADAKYYPSGYRANDISMGGYLALKAYIKGKPLILSGRLLTESRSPSYWQENLFSNHYAWFTPLSKENETRIEVKFEVPDYALELAAKQSIVTNKIYYNALSHVDQSSSDVSISSLYAHKDFRLGGFHLDHRVLMQWSSDHEVVPVPLLSAYLSYYYEFWAVKDVLLLQMGLDARYTTSYYMPGYNPALATFYNQRDYSLGGYPYMDAYLMARWQNMRIFLKYQHLNDGLFGNGEVFSVANYPLNPGMFKFGISWLFHD